MLEKIKLLTKTIPTSKNNDLQQLQLDYTITSSDILNELIYLKRATQMV